MLAEYHSKGSTPVKLSSIAIAVRLPQVNCESEVKSEVIRFWSFDFYETFICFRAYLEQKPYGGKSVQKNFLMGLKIW